MATDGTKSQRNWWVFGLGFLMEIISLARGQFYFRHKRASTLAFRHTPGPDALSGEDSDYYFLLYCYLFFFDLSLCPRGPVDGIDSSVNNDTFCSRI